MANKAISELPQAQNVNNQDLFVIEQSGLAKKLPAETFITEQGIIDALAEALDGHGGIQSVTLSSVSGRIRTYLITFTDGSATTFQVLDGTSITSIQKTSTAGLVDTYTVYMSDGTTSFFQVRNGQDGSATWDQINSKAPIITETVTGAIANFPDGADDIPMQSVLVDIEPVQSGSGDPSPSNIRPITGHTAVNVTRTGKNLLDTTKTYQQGDNQLVFGQDAGYANRNTFLKAGTYTIKITADKQCSFYLATDKNTGGSGIGTSATARTFTLTEDTHISLWGYNGSGFNSSNVTNFELVVGSSAPTAYEPYTATILPISWQTEAGTVYGGTIDVATGVLTVTQISVNFGDLSWTRSGTDTTGKYRFTSELGQTPAVADSNNETALCDRLSLIAAGQTYFCNDGFTIANGRLYVFLSDYSSLSADDFKTAVAGAQLVYTLATSQTYQLTAQQLTTLYGNNTVWSDLGDVTVTYPADTKMYIEKLTIPSEDDLVANQAITSGQYFMIGNSLYLALANIASGAAITIGTNAQRVSLADALNTINS